MCVVLTPTILPWKPVRKVDVDFVCADNRANCRFNTGKWAYKLFDISNITP